MTPLHYSTFKKTAIEGAAFAGLVYFTHTSRLFEHLPNVKTGTLLSGGALLTSSFLYNILRHDPERSGVQTLFEKGLLFAAVSFAVYEGAKRFFTVLTPKQAAALGAASCVFSAIVQKACALSPLEKTHLYYSTNPKKWFALEKKKRTELFNQFFKASLPPIFGQVEYKKKLICLNEEKYSEITEHPERFTKNQLGWVLTHDKLPIKEDTLAFAQYIVDHHIPCVDIQFEADEEGECQACLQKLLEREPIRYYVHAGIPGALMEAAPNPKDLAEALTPSAVKKMPAHILELWGTVLQRKGSDVRPSIPPDVRIAFYQRLPQLNPAELEEESFFKDIILQSGEYSKGDINWLLTYYDGLDTPKKADEETLCFFQKMLDAGHQLPMFCLGGEVDLNTPYRVFERDQKDLQRQEEFEFGGGEGELQEIGSRRQVGLEEEFELSGGEGELQEIGSRRQVGFGDEEEPPEAPQGMILKDVLHKIYSQYPLYQFLQVSEETFELFGQSSPPLLSFSSLAQRLTLSAAQRLSEHDLRVWCHVFGVNAKRWNQIPTKIQLAFLKRFKEEYPGRDFPPALSLDKLQQELVQYPNRYSRPEIAFFVESLKEDEKITIEPMYLPLIKRAIDLNISLPPVILKDEGISVGSKWANLLMELFHAYPLYQFLQTEKKILKFLKAHASSFSTFASLVEKLTPSSVKHMSEQDIALWRQVFEVNKELKKRYSVKDLVEKLWKQVPLKVQVAFLKRFKEQHPNKKLDDHFKSKALMDILLFPEDFDQPELTFILELFQEERKALEIESTFLPFFKRAVDLKIPLPPFTLKSKNFFPNSIAAELAIELFRAYPFYQFIEQEQEVRDILETAQPPLPKFETLSRKLTGASVHGMTPEDISLWYQIVESDGERWGTFSSEVQVALIQRFINQELDIDMLPEDSVDVSYVTTSFVRGMSPQDISVWHQIVQSNLCDWEALPAAAQEALIQRFIERKSAFFEIPGLKIEAGWVDLTPEEIGGLTSDQAKWYLASVGQNIQPPNFDENPFEDENINKLGRVLNKCTGEYARDCMHPIIREELAVDMDDETFKALVKKAFDVVVDPVICTSDNFGEHFRQKIKDHAYLISKQDLMKLSQEEEFFLRQQFQGEVVFNFTDRYIGYAKEQPGEIAAVCANLTKEKAGSLSKGQAEGYLALLNIQRPNFDEEPFEAEINQLGQILKKCLGDFTYQLIVPWIKEENLAVEVDDETLKALVKKVNAQNADSGVCTKEGFSDWFRNRIKEKAFLINAGELKKLTEEEEFFLRQQLLDETIFALTERYVEHLEGNAAEAQRVAVCYKGMDGYKKDHVSVYKLEYSYWERAKALLEPAKVQVEEEED